MYSWKSKANGETDFVYEVGEVVSRVAGELGCRARGGYVVKGKSGVSHFFDYMVCEEPLVVVSVGRSSSMEDCIYEVLAFAIKVIDSNGCGVYVALAKPSQSFRDILHELSSRIGWRLLVVDGSQPIEIVKSDVERAVNDMVSRAKLNPPANLS
mgnify:CR=1 FL=1